MQRILGGVFPVCLDLFRAWVLCHAEIYWGSATITVSNGSLNCSQLLNLYSSLVLSMLLATVLSPCSTGVISGIGMGGS